MHVVARALRRPAADAGWLLRGVGQHPGLDGLGADDALHRREGLPSAGADVAAAALRQVAPLAGQLRDSPAKTLGPERLEVLRGSSELLARLSALATQERRLPGGASDTVLRRAWPPRPWSSPSTSRTWPGDWRSVSAASPWPPGLMLVPSAADKSNRSNLLWVPSRGRGRGGEDGTAVVQQHASAVARAAEGVAPGVRTARVALAQRQAQIVDPTRHAAAQARNHAGAARAQLRGVLAQRASTFPPPLSSRFPRTPSPGT